ncbi:hypothetical protein [Paraburkholderia unamae]|uniref:Uncharacterized protein n=1 Tax=Paraburkholderia unamae TaxID=219649 RepID=A0ABX5KI26_9BURK|nr:hypothetical protein [Paraburkholderia unamae]PVX80101.1 hypothetical protein C7402_112288 [Paraburkholderia unamae]CAG9268515.1 hypothetical protein PUN4_560023 [Paraburkholderia unamae]
MSGTNKTIADKANVYIQAAESVSTATRNQVVEIAFWNIQSDRQRYCMNDVAITSAEHYLFARYIVGLYFLMIWPLCAIAFPGYDVIKSVLGNFTAAFLNNLRYIDFGAGR